MDSVTIEGEFIQAVSPEGQQVRLPLRDVLDTLAPQQPDSRGMILPDGVKCLVPMRRGCIVVHETPPRLWNLKWIAGGSRQPFGQGVAYRDVKVALPYVVVVAVFQHNLLTSWNECFFRNAPLDSLDDELCYPALLNCSRMDERKDKPLAWICTEYLRKAPLAQERDVGRRMRHSLRALLGHLMETGFNYSSEHHELSSWWSETVKARVDPRLLTVEAWEAASAEDPLFVLDVPWLETNHTLRKVCDRITRIHQGDGFVRTAKDIIRFLFNRK